MRHPLRLQCGVFLLSGVITGGLSYFSMMRGIWGVSIDPAHYIALAGAAMLVFAALLTWKRPELGRLLSVIGLIMTGYLWIPSTAGLIPRYNVIISPFAYIAYLLYFGSLAFALFYPIKWKLSVPIFLLCLSIGLAFAATTAFRLIQSGEYKRPSIACFRWYPGGESLIVKDQDHWIDAEMESMLKDARLHGILKWTGSIGPRSAKHRMILIAQRRPDAAFQAHYPRDCFVIYAFDGSIWLKIPPNASTFPSFATVKPENGATVLWEDVSGGHQGTGVFNW
jgi:hypothetical protein